MRLRNPPGLGARGKNVQALKAPHPTTTMLVFL